MKVLAIVKINNSYAYVIDNDINFEYDYYDGEKRELLGTYDNKYYICYAYEWCKVSKAFGGRKFNIKLKKSEVLECSGQWWRSYGDIPLKNKKFYEGLVHLTYRSIDDLRNCYCFYGCETTKENLETLFESYNGKIYEYDEYEKILRNGD